MTLFVRAKKKIKRRYTRYIQYMTMLKIRCVDKESFLC